MNWTLIGLNWTHVLPLSFPFSSTFLSSPSSIFAPSFSPALQSGCADEVRPSVQFGGRAPWWRCLHTEFPRPQRPGGGLHQRGPRAWWESVLRLLPLTIHRQTWPAQGVKRWQLNRHTDGYLWLGMSKGLVWNITGIRKNYQSHLNDFSAATETRVETLVDDRCSL